ncbi:hypothetical protein OHA71_23545 [Streptomyces sp. NBC_00444]|uniref:hypothetical protein n=1 Tax=Streptomyces sp. NBC_00444 TaxID=2975744 RepID=UPI002E210D02
MNQATQTPAPTQRTDSFQHAHTIAGAIASQLEHAPFAVEIEEDFPSGWRVHLKFRETRAAGLLAFAALVDVPVTRANSAFGVHLEAYARVEGIEVRGSALVSPDTAAQLDGQHTPGEPSPEAAAAAQPVPLGASVLAYVPAVSPAQPLNTEHLDVEDIARCVRCGCTEDAACDGGCYWVPNRQLADLCSACATPAELQAMTYTAEISDGGQ